MLKNPPVKPKKDKEKEGKEGKETKEKHRFQLNLFLLKPNSDKIETAPTVGGLSRAKSPVSSGDAETAPTPKKDSEVVWYSDVSAESVEKRRRELMGTKVAELIDMGPDPLAKLDELVSASVSPSLAPEDIPKTVEALQAIKTKHCVSNAQLVRSIFHKLFGEDISTKLVARLPLIKAFVTDSDLAAQQAVLDALTTLCARVPSVISSLPALLSALYQGDVTSEDTITRWTTSLAADSDISKAAKPFLDWLNSAEEEEGEAEEEEA